MAGVVLLSRSIRQCELIYGNARKFSEQVIVSIIGPIRQSLSGEWRRVSHCPTNRWAFLFSDGFDGHGIYKPEISSCDHSFLGETPKIRTIGIGFVMFVRHEKSSSNISKTVWLWIIKFYADIHTYIVYNIAGYDVIISFRLEVIATKLSKIPPPTASGGTSRARFRLGSRNFTPHLSRIMAPQNCLK